MGLFRDPSPEPIDWDIFYPLPSQLQVEFGSSNLHAPMTNEISCDQKDVQCQNGINALNTSEFSNSILVSSNEISYEDSGLDLRSVQFASNSINTITRAPVKDSGMCSELRSQVTHEPVSGTL